MAEVVMIGGGGHARVLLDVLRRLGHRVVGYVAPSPEGARVDLPYLGRDEDVLAGGRGSGVCAAFGLGKTDVRADRLSVLDTLMRAGMRFPPIVAPTALVHAGVALGEGTAILDGAIVGTGSRLGRGCIVNTNAAVDHDCLLGDDVHVAPGAAVCGDVVIDAGCLVGAGATLVNSVRVCAGTLVGAGATVVHDLTERGTYLGTPARKA